MVASPLFQIFHLGKRAESHHMNRHQFHLGNRASPVNRAHMKRPLIIASAQGTSTIVLSTAFLLLMGLRFRSTKTKTWGQESIPVQNAFFVILSRNPTYKSEAAVACCSRITCVVSLPEETLKNFNTKLTRRAKQSR